MKKVKQLWKYQQQKRKTEILWELYKKMLTIVHNLYWIKVSQNLGKSNFFVYIRNMLSRKYTIYIFNIGASLEILLSLVYLIPQKILERTLLNPNVSLIEG